MAAEHRGGQLVVAGEKLGGRPGALWPYSECGLTGMAQCSGAGNETQFRVPVENSEIVTVI